MKPPRDEDCFPFWNPVRQIASVEGHGSNTGTFACVPYSFAQPRVAVPPAASYRNHFFSHKVKPDHLGLLAFFEVAMNGIAHLLVKAGKIIRFSENGLPQSSRGVSAFRRFFH